MEQNFNIKNYEQYLTLLMPAIESRFEAQHEYICCKSGCALCCEDGLYPFSEMEYEYIKLGFDALPNDLKDTIKDNVRRISLEKNSLYQCPFLIDKKCSVYANRGLICRTFGLITENNEKKLTIPYCAEHGLNYSKVYDKSTHRIFEDKVKELGYNTFPKAYNLSRENLMYGIGDNLGFDWGDTKPLIEWLREYFNKGDK